MTTALVLHMLPMLAKEALNIDRKSQEHYRNVTMTRSTSYSRYVSSRFCRASKFFAFAGKTKVSRAVLEGLWCHVNISHGYIERGELRTPSEGCSVSLYLLIHFYQLRVRVGPESIAIHLYQSHRGNDYVAGVATQVALPTY